MAYTYGNTQNAAERIKEISGVNPLKCGRHPHQSK